MVRIASYNVENLFERAKVLNGIDGAKNAAKLGRIAELEEELSKVEYDKKKILDLYNDLKDLIEIREDKGKLFVRQGFAIKSVKAKGRNDWDGGIEFKKEPFSDATRGNTAKVIREMKADILCLVEVEGRHAIDNFRYNLLASMKYKTNLSIEGNDPRGIDVGMIARYPINQIHTHIFDERNNRRIFSRDCLEVELQVNTKDTVTVLINHLKSKGYGQQVANDSRRKAQCEQIAEILKKYDLKKDYVVVCGDMNDTPDSDPMKPLLQVSGLYDALALEIADPAERWTYHYGKGNQIDYLLISEALKSKLRAVGIERRGIYNLNKLTKGQESSWAEVTGPRTSASDHAGIWADFDI